MRYIPMTVYSVFSGVIAFEQLLKVVEGSLPSAPGEL